eukprot:gene24477-29767_t
MDESTDGDANLNEDGQSQENLFGSEDDFSDNEDGENFSSTGLEEGGDDDDDDDADFEAMLAAQNRFLQNNAPNQSLESGGP